MSGLDEAPSDADRPTPFPQMLPAREAPADEAGALRLRAAEHVHAARASVVAGSFAALVAMGSDILKSVALINGGAGAATLVMMASALHDNRPLARGLVLPLCAFGFGLVVAACATGWSYLSHASSAEALRRREPIWTPPYLADTPESDKAAQAGLRYERLAFAAVLVGIASTVIGFCLAGFVALVTLG